MEFSRHPNVRTERLDQLAATLGALYPPLGHALPPIIVEKLEQLERAELRADQLVRDDALLAPPGRQAFKFKLNHDRARCKNPSLIGPVNSDSKKRAE